MVRAPRLLVVAAIGGVVLFLSADFSIAQLCQDERSGHFRTAREDRAPESRRDRARRSRDEGRDEGWMRSRGDRARTEDRADARDEPTRRQVRVSQRRQSDSRQVTGEITQLKQARIRGATHRVVRLRTDNGQRLVADLGPAAQLEKLNLEPGARITVAGPALTIGESRLLWAQKVTADGQRVAIARARPTLQGRVAETWTAPTRRDEHRFARLETSHGEVLVDLGPADQWAELDLQSQKITVAGPAMQVRNQPILRAERLELNGDVVEIARTEERRERRMSRWLAEEPTRTARRGERRDNLLDLASQWLGLEDAADASPRADERAEMRGERREMLSSESAVTIPARAPSSLTGEVDAIRALDVQGATHMLVRLQTEQGNRRWVDLGPNRLLQLRLDRGATVRVTGVPVQTPRGALLAAETLRIDDRQFRINRGGLMGRLRAASSTFAEGEVQSAQTANLRGATRQLVTLRTDEGRQLIVDLGGAAELPVTVQQGDRIAVQGVALGLPDGPALLLAERLRKETAVHDTSTATRDRERR